MSLGLEARAGRLFLPLARTNRSHLHTMDRRGLRDRSAGGEVGMLDGPGH
jgi:hypothetical protein